MKTNTTKWNYPKKASQAKRPSNYPNKTIQEVDQTNKNQKQEAHVCRKQHNHA
jgi:hypothetical protein